MRSKLHIGKKINELAWLSPFFDRMVALAAQSKSLMQFINVKTEYITLLFQSSLSVKTQWNS